MKKTTYIITITTLTIIACFLAIVLTKYQTVKLRDDSFVLRDKAIDSLYLKNEEDIKKDIKEDNNKENNINQDKKLDSTQNKKKTIKRLNILVLGIEEDPRSDTIMFVSFDYTNTKLDIISIPRDTYYYEQGFESGGHRRINAAYVREGEEGSIKAVENILDISIDNYISIKYDGVEKIVDLIGGVEVNVPSWLDDLPSGKQTLNGDQSVDFLRGRKGYSSGDIGRIKAQQEFVSSFINKSLNMNIIDILKKSYKEVETDLKLTEILYYAYKIKEIQKKDINMTILPGKASLDKVGNYRYWYYHHDKEKTKEIINKFYSANK